MHSYTALTPVTFLERSGRAFPTRNALLHAGRGISFDSLLHRTRCLAQALNGLQVLRGDRIAVLTHNSVQAIECHFAVPSVGGLIVMINPWLCEQDMTDMLNHCEASVLIADSALFHGLESWPKTLDHPPKLILFNQTEQGVCSGALDYESLINEQNGSRALDESTRSEMEPIAINFTSGTTGRPKGVMFTHRAAYLHALGQVLMLELTRGSNYLWTLPMFHVNGWGHMWACVAVGCTQVISDNTAFKSPDNTLANMIAAHKITHIAGAPRLIRALTHNLDKTDVFRNLTVLTGGAAPPPNLIQEVEALGIRLIHQYGLNETCGPFVVCEEQDQWCLLPPEERVRLRSRQGLAALHAGTGVRVLDEQGRDVAQDGHSLGEVVMAGNTVALGYFNNAQATAESFRDGWFHSGDMAVVHADGYLQIRDRMKDLIFVETQYGWENISSIEVENVLCRHEAIKDAAVICVPINDSPLLVAFVELKASHCLDEQAFKRYCESTLSVYKQPKAVYFSEIPKTATGKVRKDSLVKEAISRLALAS